MQERSGGHHPTGEEGGNYDRAKHCLFRALLPACRLSCFEQQEERRESQGARGTWALRWAAVQDVRAFRRWVVRVIFDAATAETRMRSSFFRGMASSFTASRNSSSPQVAPFADAVSRTTTDQSYPHFLWKSHWTMRL